MSYKKNNGLGLDRQKQSGQSLSIAYMEIHDNRVLLDHLTLDHVEQVQLVLQLRGVL